MTAFDHFLIVDWSARNAPSSVRPSRDAIWLADGSASLRRADGRSEPIRLRYFRTRESAMLAIRRRLLRLSSQGKRVLLGCDFSFGYPKGLAKSLNLKGLPWRAIWKEWHRLINDDDRNRNNRFRVAATLNRRIGAHLGPFWGVPRGQSGIFLGPAKDFKYPVRPSKKVSLAEKRLVEERHSRLQSSWKLAYAGSVGSQSLLGIPYLYDLCFADTALKELPRVWPFQTSLAYPTDAQIVIAEIWPSLIPRPGRDSIPDREQVRTYLKWLRDKQSDGNLAQLFSGPEDLSKKDRKRVEKHEGWILGVV